MYEVETLPPHNVGTLRALVDGKTHLCEITVYQMVQNIGRKKKVIKVGKISDKDETLTVE